MIFIKAVYETLMPQTELLNKHITVFLSLETINYRHQWKEGIIIADSTIFKEKLAKIILWLDVSISNKYQWITIWCELTYYWALWFSTEYNDNNCECRERGNKI